MNNNQTPKGREVVVVGWDGRSNPMLRYRDELHLPDLPEVDCPVRKQLTSYLGGG